MQTNGIGRIEFGPTLGDANEVPEARARFWISRGVLAALDAGIEKLAGVEFEILASGGGIKATDATAAAIQDLKDLKIAAKYRRGLVNTAWDNRAQK